MNYIFSAHEYFLADTFPKHKSSSKNNLRKYQKTHSKIVCDCQGPDPTQTFTHRNTKKSATSRFLNRKATDPFLFIFYFINIASPKEKNRYLFWIAS